MNAARPQMRSSGPDPVLERVTVEGALSSTFARIRMAQTYRNTSDTNIEIVYTFPLPLRSTLLDVVTVLDGKRYRGTVLAKREAEESYEDAIEKGDTALMVESPEPGLYVMNLGNLMAGESATIEVEFAMLLDWRGKQLRLSLPMTLAPRYDEANSPLAPHQKPQQDILVERAFSLKLLLSGEFSGAAIASPTHRLATRFTEEGVQVTLQRNEAWMDRDFVLTAEAPAAPQPFACVAPGEDGSVLYASFLIPASHAVAPARDVKVVLDCSGSMQGDSIALARAGVLKLLERLRPEDRFALVAFGTHSILWEKKVMPASEHNLEAASAWVRERDAGMGGTEMAGALASAISIPGAGRQCDVFLITDGQVGRTPEVIKAAKRAGHRMFIVGVGVAPQQDALREMAEGTGGAIEWVTPGEAIADAIHRIFARLVEVPVSDLRLVSGGGFAWEARSPARSVFTGDTVHFFGAPRDADSSVHVEWRQPDGTAVRLPLAPGEAPQADVQAAIPRVAASLRIRDAQRQGRGSAEAASLAVKYQLVTPESSYVLVVDREGIRATGMPAIRQVPHMLAARSVGMRAEFGAGESLSSAFLASTPKDPTRRAKRDVDSDALQFLLKENGMALYSHGMPSHLDIAKLVASANRRHASLLSVIPLAEALAELFAALGIHGEEGLHAELAEMARAEGEKRVVLAFWAVLRARAGEHAIHRGLRRSMKRAGLPASADAQLVRAINARLERYLHAATTAA